MTQKFLFINFYNANAENNQLVTLDTLISLLENHNLDGSFHPIFSGDFNNIFDTILDASGGNPSLKKKSIAKIISITEKLILSTPFVLLGSGNTVRRSKSLSTNTCRAAEALQNR